MTARQFDIDLIKARMPLSELIGHDVTWSTKKTSKQHRWACCPLHGEGSPSFQCTDTKGMFYCYGCQAGGDHFAYLKARHGMQFGEAVKYLAGLTGIGPEIGLNDNNPALEAEREKYRQQQQEREKKIQADKDKRQLTAQGIWNEGIPISGTPAATYLFNRGGFKGPWPESLRYHPECLYELEGKPFKYLPAMICRVDNAAGQQIGLWRIFITQDGHKNETLKSNKVGLGPCKTGAVRLWMPSGGEIGACEGVETAFGANGLTQLPIWAMLSTSGLTGFEVPFEINKIRIFPDYDGWRENGQGQWIEGPGITAAKQGSENYQEQGAIAIIEPEPIIQSGKKSDYLDLYNAVRGR